jgi:DNA-binding transcriptional MerR regulator
VPEESWLTIAELAGRLAVSESTIRNWRRRYAGLIPSAYGPDGVRRYPPQPFETVAAMRRRNRPVEDIRAALAANGEPEPSAESYEARVIAILERLASAAERIADAMGRPGEG